VIEPLSGGFVEREASASLFYAVVPGIAGKRLPAKAGMTAQGPTILREPM
jgi:hypothetical protein